MFRKNLQKKKHCMNGKKIIIDNYKNKIKNNFSHLDFQTCTQHP